MLIGLIILGVVAILIFFGLGERFFRKMGIAGWLAFLLVLALVIGAVIPNIVIGSFSMNISGFLIPVALCVLFLGLMGKGQELFRALVSIMSVAAITVGVKMLIAPVSDNLEFTGAIIIGFVGGAAAFLIGQTRLATIASAFGGIVLGDVISEFIYRYIINQSPISLGTANTFDSIIIAAVFGGMLVEVIRAIKSTMNRKRIARSALNLESGAELPPLRDDGPQEPCVEDEYYKQYIE